MPRQGQPPEGWVLMVHPDAGGEQYVNPRTVEYLQTRGWKVKKATKKKET